MSGLDDRAALERVLEPGSELRAFGQASVAYGEAGPATEWEGWDDLTGRAEGAWAFVTRTWPRRILFFTALLPVTVVVAVTSVGSIDDRLARALGGVTCAGPRGSRARQMQHAMSPLGGRGGHLAVTDTEVLVAKVPIGLLGRRADPEVAWSCPLTDVMAAERRPRGVLRRRVQISFVDGSRIVLALPLFDAPRPRQVVGTLTGPM